MLTVTCTADRVLVGERFAVSFQRTLRLPDDGQRYPLPPGLGAFPIHRVADFAERVPATWRERGGFFVPLYQREALWLQFEAAFWKPNAVQVGIGGINAISGQPWSAGLQGNPQNYLVCPDQPWLDGINSGDGTVRQFVAVALGAGDTVEEQLTGEATVGGMQLQVYEPKPGRFPDRAPAGSYGPLDSLVMEVAPAAGELGIAAGGEMEQKIYADPHGIAAWDEHNFGVALIHIVNSQQYQAITGQPPPPSPVTAELYTQMGLPWFALYDEDRGYLPPSERLMRVKSLGELAAEGDSATEEERPVSIDPGQIVTLKPEQASDE